MKEMQDIKGKKILLGITGGIAAYKSALLIRELTGLGAEVRTIMTESAKAFITPLTLQALSGYEVRTTLFDTQAERAMGHIELARWADFFVISPASANTIAKCANGLADDLLSTVYLAGEAPVLICPAMNHKMWSHQATQENIEKLKNHGCQIIGPDKGEQACGEYGYGRLSDVSEIIDGIRLATIKPCLKGQHILITAGPTREALDPVRYLTNHSSGKMGYALAKAAKAAGARVTLVSGPTNLPKPSDVAYIGVLTAAEMLEAVKKNIRSDMIFIGAAAVADYKPAQWSSIKIKKTESVSRQLSLVKNPDIITEVTKNKLAKFVVGFAAETQDVITLAKQKMKKKQLDMVIANQVGEGLGFDAEKHEVTLITSSTQISLPFDHKLVLSAQIITFIADQVI